MCVCCVRTRVYVYPLSHGGVVIRRVPPVPAYRIGATKRHVVKEKGSRTKAAKAERTLLFTYPHWPAREGTGTHSRSLHSRVKRGKKYNGRIPTTLLRHVYMHTLTNYTPGYVRSCTYTYTCIYIYIHTMYTCESTLAARLRRRGCPNGCRRTHEREQKHAATEARNPCNRYRENERERDRVRACGSTRCITYRFRAARMFPTSRYTDCVSRAAS